MHCSAWIVVLCLLSACAAVSHAVTLIEDVDEVPGLAEHAESPGRADVERSTSTLPDFFAEEHSLRDIRRMYEFLEISEDSLLVDGVADILFGSGEDSQDGSQPTTREGFMRWWNSQLESESDDGVDAALQLGFQVFGIPDIESVVSNVDEEAFYSADEQDLPAETPSSSDSGRED
jgi:hypothetical protein